MSNKDQRTCSACLGCICIAAGFFFWPLWLLAILFAILSQHKGN